MTLLLTEGVVDQVLEYLQDRIEEKLDQISAEHLEDVPLPAPLAWYVGEQPLKAGENYPAVFVFGEGMTIGGAEGVRVVYSGAMVDAGHDITVMVALRAQDTELLQRQMYRYVVAIWELLVQHHFDTTGHNDHFFILGGAATAEYQRPEADLTTGPYIAKAWLRFTAEKQETY